MFKWNESFATGIKTIDSQHQRLFEIGEEIEVLLNTYLDQSTLHKTEELLHELRDYTIYHFNTEKELFHKFNYPDLDHHLSEHDKFVDYLNKVDMDDIKMDQEEFLNNLLRTVAQWIFKHINSEDFKYVPFLKDKIQ
ncbi:MAG: hemerythrin family protein [Clostridiales bacterium]|nr:hemerythrin family protein [Clostridiales bacterium]